MFSKLVIGGVLVSSSLLASSSTTCQSSAVSQSDPNLCSVTYQEFQAMADASAYGYSSGNSFYAGVSTETMLNWVGQSDFYPSAEASATASDTVAVPPSSPGDSYDVSFFNYASSSFEAPSPSGFPLSGCTPEFNGETCSFTMSASQLASLSTFTMFASSYINTDMTAFPGDQYDSEEMSLTISQFDAAGDPVDFAISPEPGTVGTAACAFLLTGFVLRRRSGRK